MKYFIALLSFVATTGVPVLAAPSLPAPATPAVQVSLWPDGWCVNLDIVVDAWENPTIDASVSAVKADASALPLQVVQQGDATVITGKYSCTRGGIHNWIHTKTPTFRVVVHVPQGTKLSAKSTSGSVEIHGVRGAIVASSTNGSVTIDGASSIVHATSTNGDVSLTVIRNTDVPKISLSSVNGSIGLRVPSGFSAPVKASAVNGSVNNPLESLTGIGSAVLQATNGSVSVNADS